MSEKPVVTAKHLVLNYLLEKSSEVSRADLLNDLYEIFKELRVQGIEVEIDFKGPFRGHALSDAIDGEVYYWLSNGFIVERPVTGTIVLTEEAKDLLEGGSLREKTARQLGQQASATLYEIFQKVT